MASPDANQSTPQDRPRHSDYWKELTIAAAREGWPGYHDGELDFDPNYYIDIYGAPMGPIPSGRAISEVYVH